MLSEDSFPSLKKSIPTSNNDTFVQKPIIMKYSDVLKQKKTNNINNTLKFSEIVEKKTNEAKKTNTVINDISEKTKNLSLNHNECSTECDVSKSHSNNEHNINQNKEEDIQKKYQNDLDKIIKIQTWWRIVSKINSLKNIKKNSNEEKSGEKKDDNQKRDINTVKTVSKKPSFSDIVKLSPSPKSVNNEEPLNNLKKQNKRNKKNNMFKNRSKVENERKNQSKTKKINEELNTKFKNMKFMGLIEKEIDALTKKNTIVNGKQFAKTKIVTVKKFSRNGSFAKFNIDEIINSIKENKNKSNKNENETSDIKSHSKKNVCFNEKDEVFNEYNHVMKKLDLQRRCDKKSCLIDCYRRLYKREWKGDEEVSEESITSNSESEDNNEIITTTPLKKESDYLYNDIYNPNYTKYYSGSDFDFGNRYFTGKERLKKALYLEPVEITVKKIIYQPIKFHKNRRFQQKKKNNNKRKQKSQTN